MLAAAAAAVAAARHPALTAAAAVILRSIALLIAVTLNQVSCSPRSTVLPFPDPISLLVAHQILNSFYIFAH